MGSRLRRHGGVGLQARALTVWLRLHERLGPGEVRQVEHEHVCRVASLHALDEPAEAEERVARGEVLERVPHPGCRLGPDARGAPPASCHWVERPEVSQQDLAVATAEDVELRALLIVLAWDGTRGMSEACRRGRAGRHGVCALLLTHATEDDDLLPDERGGVAGAWWWRVGGLHDLATHYEPHARLWGAINKPCTTVVLHGSGSTLKTSVAQVFSGQPCS
eukprot:scaffold58239_cov62-Phaeocystis_antarctica.AAC.8